MSKPQQKKKKKKKKTSGAASASAAKSVAENTNPVANSFSTPPKKKSRLKKNKSKKSAQDKAARESAAQESVATPKQHTPVSAKKKKGKKKKRPLDKASSTSTSDAAVAVADAHAFTLENVLGSYRCRKGGSYTHMISHIWAHIYDHPHMIAYIWFHTYDRSHISTHIWSPTYDCIYMISHIWSLTYDCTHMMQMTSSTFRSRLSSKRIHTLWVSTRNLLSRWSSRNRAFCSEEGWRGTSSVRSYAASGSCRWCPSPSPEESTSWSGSTRQTIPHTMVL